MYLVSSYQMVSHQLEVNKIFLIKNATNERCWISASFERNMPEIRLNLSFFHPFEWEKEKWFLKAWNGRGEKRRVHALLWLTCLWQLSSTLLFCFFDSINFWVFGSINIENDPILFFENFLLVIKDKFREYVGISEWPYLTESRFRLPPRAFKFKNYKDAILRRIKPRLLERSISYRPIYHTEPRGHICCFIWRRKGEQVQELKEAPKSLVLLPFHSPCIMHASLSFRLLSAIWPLRGIVSKGKKKIPN